MTSIHVNQIRSSSASLHIYIFDTVLKLSKINMRVDKLPSRFYKFCNNNVETCTFFFFYYINFFFNHELIIHAMILCNGFFILHAFLVETLFICMKYIYIYIIWMILRSQLKFSLKEYF